MKFEHTLIQSFIPFLEFLQALAVDLSFAQRSKKPKGSTVSVSTAINYYPAIEPYSFFSSLRIAMDFKVIPNMLLGDFGSIVEETPLAPVSEQAGEREYNLPEINMAFSLLLRYVIKEPRK